MINKIDNELIDRLNNLADTLRKRVIGQDRVINDILDIFKNSELGHVREGRPKGNFLFAGPTGVGKTEISLALAHALYGSEEKLIRFDMAEYSDKRYIATLMGDQSQNDPGRMAKGLQKLGKEGGIILIDEMEKAHPDIMLVFLAALDAARFTPGDGITYDLQNHYFIFTSNVGSMKISEGKFKSHLQMINSIKSEYYRLGYKHEFIGRFDVFACFNKLDFDTQKLLARMKIKSEVKRIKTKLNYDLQYDDDLIFYCIENGADPKLGARPMRNFIEKTIQAALTDKVLSKEDPNGFLKVDFFKKKCWIENEEKAEVKA